MPQTVTLTFFRFGGWRARVWALVQMGAARWPLSRTPGIGFWKLCGSGTGEGFTPVPNTAVYAILATWPDADTARAQTVAAPVYRRYRAHAAESWTIFMTPTSVRGKWAGTEPFSAIDTLCPGPLAVMTRATIRPRVALRFWGRVPRISDVIGTDPNVAFKIGIGEVPWLHQVTFSVWPDVASVVAFARHGPHADAIRAVRDEGWFSEELYARFRVDGAVGTWDGAAPLHRLEVAA